MYQLSFKRHRFPPDIIRYSIWLYARFTLSFRDVEEMLAERGLDISYETVRRWFLKFGSVVAANLRRALANSCFILSSTGSTTSPSALSKTSSETSTKPHSPLLATLSLKSS